MKTSVFFLASMMMAAITVAQNPVNQNIPELIVDNNKNVLYASNLISFELLKNYSPKYSSETIASFNFGLIFEKKERNLELENWMLNESIFDVFAKYLEVETEEPLKLECWMTDETVFTVNSILYETETEEKLEFEDWMMNEYLFTPIVNDRETEKPLELEDWMFNSNYWK